MNEGMRVSQRGISLVKEFEGLYLNAYQDSVGVWTIGYGHTQGVYPGMTITEKQAEELLTQDLLSHATGIFKFVTVPLNQNQFDALASFHFNLGAYILQGSTLLTYINSKNWTAAANEMKRYVYAGGEILPGLVRRRNAEAALFLDGNVTPAPKPNNSGNANNQGRITTMQCLYERPRNAKGEPDNNSNEWGIFFCNGINVRHVSHPDTVHIIKEIYKLNNGHEIPTYTKKQWPKNAPWYERLESVMPFVK